MQFPPAKARNLLRHQVHLPEGLEGDVNILLVAFQQWQQRDIDTWLPFVQSLENTYQGVCYYELPVIQRMNVVARTFINEGMRAGIPDPLARERTITLYLDKTAFRRQLDLPHEEDIYVLLVDRQGQVLWRVEGAFSHDKGAELTRAVDDVDHTTGSD